MFRSLLLISAENNNRRWSKRTGTKAAYMSTVTANPQGGVTFYGVVTWIFQLSSNGIFRETASSNWCFSSSENIRMSQDDQLTSAAPFHSIIRLNPERNTSRKMASRLIRRNRNFINNSVCLMASNQQMPRRRAPPVLPGRCYWHIIGLFWGLKP